MQISKVSIKNYKILRDVEIELNKLSAIIGSNNSGKTSFLEALTLPFSCNEIPSKSKRLGLTDFNDEIIKEYLEFVVENKEKIKDNNGQKSDEIYGEFLKKMPYIEVKVEFNYKEEEYLLLTDILSDFEEESRDFRVSLTYLFTAKEHEIVFQNLKSILNSEVLNEDGTNLGSYINNLLPMDLFEHRIFVSNRYIRIPYELYQNLKYDFISTNRDEFSSTNYNLGSKSLVTILNSKLTEEKKLELEKDYSDFFW